MIHFITMLISILSGALAILSGFGIAVDNDLQQFFRGLTSVPLSWVFFISLFISVISTIAASNSSSPLSPTTIKKGIQMNFGGSGNSNNIS